MLVGKNSFEFVRLPYQLRYPGSFDSPILTNVSE